MELAIFTFPDHRTVKWDELVGGCNAKAVGFCEDLDFVVAQLVKWAIHRTAIDSVTTAGTVTPAAWCIMGAGHSASNMECHNKCHDGEKNFHVGFFPTYQRRVLAPQD